MTARAETAKQRKAVFAALERRNRLVGILRIGVPALGLVVFSGLVLQIVVASLAADFGIGRITLDRDSVVVETPQYSGVMGDGSTYLVSAASARAPLSQMDLIKLSDGVLLVEKQDGASMKAEAPTALLDTTREQVTIEGEAFVSNSQGARGTLNASFVDYPAQTVTSTGGVDITFSDGMNLKAQTMHYDGALWRFSRVTLTIPPTGAPP